MKQLIPIVLIALFASCSTPGKPSKSIFDKSEIDLNDVQSITIGKTQKDTAAHKLNNQEMEEFVESWNSASSKGMCKYLPKYWITIYGKDSTERSFRINGKNIKESNDECFDLVDTKLAEKWYN